MTGFLLTTDYCLLSLRCLPPREDDGGGGARGFAQALGVASPQLALRAVGEDAERDEATGGDVGQHLRHPARAVEDDERVDDDERQAELGRPELTVADVEAP